jgi:general secretion pathway protein G
MNKIIAQPPSTGYASSRQRGFTLLELLVVIVIIGLLAGLIGPRYFETVGKSKSKVARAQMVALEESLEQYRLDIGSFPKPEEGLQALIVPPSGAKNWQGPYLKKGVPNDPWDRPYIYAITSGREVDLRSLGSDGQVGGDGDARDISLADTQ